MRRRQSSGPGTVNSHTPLPPESVYRGPSANHRFPQTFRSEVCRSSGTESYVKFDDKPDLGKPPIKVKKARSKLVAIHQVHRPAVVSLARSRSRHLVYDHEVPRHFVPGQVQAAMNGQIGQRRCRCLVD